MEFANVDYGNSYKVPPDRAAMPELNIQMPFGPLPSPTDGSIADAATIN